MRENKMGGSVVDRRRFLKTGSVAGLGLAGAAMVGSELGAFDKVGAARRLGLGSTGVKAAGPTATDIEVLQFALNLEYLEAEFYSYAVTGKSLKENGVNTASGSGEPGGPTTGGAQAPPEILKTPRFKAIGEQLMHDEITHVNLLHSALGADAIAKPAINLAAMGAMNDARGFLILARDLEVTGVSAYGGAITLLSEAVLQTAAQIALIEGIHVGNLQLLVANNGIPVSPLDGMDVVPPPSGTLYFDEIYSSALAVIRTTSEVLSIVYGSSKKGTNKGGFFPNGVNGAITTV